MNPRRVIETLENKCMDVPERVPGYNKALFDAASGVIWDEHEHAIRETTIMQKIKERCECLAKFAFENQQLS